MPCGAWEQIVTAVVMDFAREPVRSIVRFPQGLHHHVYDVTCDGGRTLVVRLTDPDEARYFEAARRWNDLLAPLGVPLPRILAAGVRERHPFMVLERLPGRDISEVYETLGVDQKRELAAAMAGVQDRVGRLPDGSGYGDALSYEGPFSGASWAGAIDGSIARSRARIGRESSPPAGLVELVEAGAAALAPYFAAVRPRPYLDDVTTKNVIVDHGRLSGIVDVDWLCFGDRLTTVGLTRASALGAGWNPDYAGFLLDAFDPDAAERRAARFYTALYCLDLISETGLRFNKDAPPPVDARRLERLERTLMDELSLL